MKRLLFCLGVLLTGCAVGPLVNHETGRTVGKGHSDIMGGYGISGYAFKWNYGLTDRIDLGAQWETLSLGVRAKYALQLNKFGGWSWAVAAGTGLSTGGTHYYGDFMGSYLHSWIEPYGTVRIVHVKTDPVEFRDQNTGRVDFTLGGAEYNYGQIMAGSRFWLSTDWIFSVEASTLFAVTSGLRIRNGFLASAALGYRF